MVERGSGRVINIGSALGLVTLPFTGALGACSVLGRVQRFGMCMQGRGAKLGVPELDGSCLPAAEER
jgi:hypothetical protein